MISWRYGVVNALGKRWGRAQELSVVLDSPSLDSHSTDSHSTDSHSVDSATTASPDQATAASSPAGVAEARTTSADSRVVKALAYEELVGEIEVGTPVALNAGAVLRGLGTGGYAFVVARLDRAPHDQATAGHIVKARYTPMQSMVMAIDEQDSPHHEVLAEADDLCNMPVVVADLHSALPAIIAGARARHGADLRIVYVMTDGAALPLAFSRNAVALKQADWLTATITAGQSFGGDYEAVTVASALLAAKHVLEADLAIVCQGPGNAGTGTKWGFSGIEVGSILNTVAALGGVPIGALRISGSDPRPRHRGISHHSMTAIARLAMASVEIPVPVLGSDLDELIAQQVAGLPQRHRISWVPTESLRPVLTQTPVRLSSMGRTLSEDPAPFLAAGVAGVHAAGLVPGH